MSKKRIDPKHEAGARCGYTRQGHYLANYSDGPMVGISVLICPFATWKDAVPPSPAGTTSEK